MKNNVRSCIDQLFQDADRIDGIRIEVDVDDSADSGLFSKYTQEAASATIVDISSGELPIDSSPLRRQSA